MCSLNSWRAPCTQELKKFFLLYNPSPEFVMSDDCLQLRNQNVLMLFSDYVVFHNESMIGISALRKKSLSTLHGFLPQNLGKIAYL